MQRQSLGWADRRVRETIRRSKVLEDYRTGGRQLVVRLGTSGRRACGGMSDASARYWAAFAVRQLVAPYDTPDTRLTGQFKFNKGDQCLYVGVCSEQIWPNRVRSHPWLWNSRGRTRLCEIGLPGRRGETAGQTITAVGNDEESSVVLMSSRFSDHDQIGSDVAQQITFLKPHVDEDWYMHRGFGLDPTINDLHGCPVDGSHSSGVSIAYATTEGVFIARPFPTSLDMDVDHLLCMGHKEQMTVGYRDPNTLMAGARSGKIRLADLRVHKSVLRLGHGSAVSAMRWMNDSLILVHGLGSMCIYDIRFARRPRTAPRAPAKGHQARTRNPTIETPITPSEPYLNFAVPAGRTSDRYGLGFDYDPEMNVVAAASSNTTYGHHLTLYSASTGKVMGGGDLPLTETQYASPVTCVEWARVRDGPKSLLLASGGLIEEWTPQGREDAD